ncbi:hypothetical protein Tco_1163023 [Tanacetum coccineum]
MSSTTSMSLNSRIGIINIKAFETRGREIEVCHYGVDIITLNPWWYVSVISARNKSISSIENIIRTRDMRWEGRFDIMLRIGLKGSGGRGEELLKDEFTGEIIGKRNDLREKNRNLKCLDLATVLYKIRFRSKESNFPVELNGLPSSTSSLIRIYLVKYFIDIEERVGESKIHVFLKNPSYGRQIHSSSENPRLNWGWGTKLSIDIICSSWLAKLLLALWLRRLMIGPKIAGFEVASKQKRMGVFDSSVGHSIVA